MRNARLGCCTFATKHRRCNAVAQHTDATYVRCNFEHLSVTHGYSRRNYAASRRLSEFLRASHQKILHREVTSSFRTRLKTNERNAATCTSIHRVIFTDCHEHSETHECFCSRHFGNNVSQICKHYSRSDCFKTVLKLSRSVTSVYITQSGIVLIMLFNFRCIYRANY